MFLSQPGMAMQRVVPLGAHDRLDRVGDQVARLERVAHAVGAHRDAVADTPIGVEPHADHAGRRHAFLDLVAEVEQVHVAGVALVPDAADADLRLVHVGFGQAGAVEHRLRRALALGLGDSATVSVECGHGRNLSKGERSGSRWEFRSPFSGEWLQSDSGYNAAE